MNDPQIDITPGNFGEVLENFSLTYENSHVQLNRFNDLCFDYISSVIGRTMKISLNLELSKDPKASIIEYIEKLKKYSEYAEEKILPRFQEMQDNINPNITLPPSILITRLNREHILVIDEAIEAIKETNLYRDDIISYFRDMILPVIIKISERINTGSLSSSRAYHNLKHELSSY